MRRLVVSVALLVASTAAAQAQDRQSFDLIERGRYLTVLGDCAACHTAPGGRPYAGGLGLETPFGKIYVPNITPDRDTGIGTWTDQEFAAALRDGNGKKAHLYPAMPYPAYTKLSDEDVLAIRAYLATLEPVSSRRMANELPFPLNIRSVMLVWNKLNFTPGRFQPNPQKSAQWNRGAYIVEGAAHCGTCHTPKNILGGDKSGTQFTGGTLQGWFAPNITTDAHQGIGGWSKQDLVEYLKTGSNSWTLASGPMADAVSHSTSKMTDEDIAAIATYLKDSGIDSSMPKPTPVAANDSAMQAGAAIYKDNCAVCHRDTGMGEAHLFPRLAGSATVQSEDPTTLAHVVLQGTRAVSTSGRPTAPAMPAFDWRLSNVEAAAVLTYIRNSWGNAAPAVPAAAIASQRTGQN
jgi:mono/diheme cytochrome c family protein